MNECNVLLERVCEYTNALTVGCPTYHTNATLQSAEALRTSSAHCKDPNGSLSLGENSMSSIKLLEVEDDVEEEEKGEVVSIDNWSYD